MTKHIIGQSIYQLIILFIILFLGPQFIKETNASYIQYGFGFKYCFNASVIVQPSFNPMNITNPYEYVQNTQPDVYLISGLSSLFTDSKNITQFANTSYCNNLFDSALDLKGAYTAFISV